MTTFIVTTLNDVVDADDGVTSLREAIALANANADADIITFAPELTGVTIYLTSGQRLSITRTLTIDGDIDGDGKPDITVSADANGDAEGNAATSRVFSISGGASSISATLNGLIIRDGNDDDVGGGIFVGDDDKLTLTNSTVSNNSTADLGGGIFADFDSIVTLTSVTLSDNHAGTGGGIFANSGSAVTLTNATLSGNSAGDGAGIYAGELSTVTLTNATLSGNAGFSGIYADDGSTVTLTNSIVAGNGAIVAAEIPILIGGNIVGGIFTIDGITQATGIALTDIFAAIDPATGGGVLADNGGPVQTIALKADPSNPAIDAGGSGGGLPTTDARGLARFDFEGAAHNGMSITDLGAYETQGSLVVTTLADVVNAADGFTSLREAIQFANANPGADTITFAPGLAGGTIYLTTGVQLFITSNLTIDGDINHDGTPDVTVSADANGDVAGNAATDRVFMVHGGSGPILATLNGLIIRDGVAIRGGGISVGAGDMLTLTNSTLSGNSAERHGGGILAEFGNTVTLINATLSGNSVADDGGGIHADFGGTVTLINSMLSGNSAGRDGGGILAADGTVTLTNTTLSGNSAGGDGGGILADANVTLTNATLSGNSAGGDGGGIYALGTVTLTNATLSGNSAGGDGGGIYARAGSSVTLVNSIVAGNDALEDILGSTTLTGGNIVGDTFTIEGVNPVHDIALTDIFAAIDVTTGGGLLADNGGPVKTIALKLSATNPALDTSNTLAPATDARGESRVDQAGIANSNGSPADLGAFEATELPSLVVTTLIDVVDDRDGHTSLREAVAYANSQTGADTITFTTGLTGLLRLTGGTLNVTDTLTIDGQLHPDGTPRVTISGDANGDDIRFSPAITDIAASTTAGTLVDNVRIFQATQITLNGLVLTGGVTSGSGGAVSGTGTVTITNSIVSGNSAGGGGGGIAALTAELTNSTVSGNSAGELGGGIDAGTANLTNSTVSGNSAGNDGGGIYASTATLTNSTVAFNLASQDGGGVFASGSLSLTNATLSGNFAGDEGGGIFNAGTADVVNSLILGNDAVTSGGQIHNAASGTVNITNTILSGNARQVFAATVDIGGGVLAGVLADNGGPVKTIALRAFVTNPALDFSDSSAPETDARGEDRVDLSDVANTNGAPADLGAYELTGEIGFAITGTSKADTINAKHAPKGQHRPGGGDDVILGGAGNDKISGLGGDDTIVGGKGADKMRGGDGEDIFQFNSLAELKTVKTVKKVVDDHGGGGRGEHSAHHLVTSHKVLSDHILDFTSGEDRLDFSRMDADKTQGGAQSFDFIGTQAFSGTAGELRYAVKSDRVVVSGDVNGDGQADFKLVLHHASAFDAGDLILI